VISGAQGERVTDGPFAEATEGIGGYFFLTVDSLDEATRVAQQCPSLPYGMVVEVRPVADACAALGVRARPAVAAGAAL
ncbi:MAG TPA: YciI family protein, partial [Opitutaceae bacterium]|nr:YciI family protein [Opitutaceae bacterium]